jgi:GNAT superfamily N-acetyltransferase
MTSESRPASPWADWRPGVRVVVRRRLPEGGATDVLGELVAAGPTELRVLTTSGEVVVAVGEVVAAKTVPPRASRRGPAHRALSVRDLEDVMADGWRAPETAWLGGPGGWLLRAAEGFTGRGNSALPLGDPGLPAAAALHTAAGWYAERGLPATVVLPEPLEAGGSPLRAALEQQGWTQRTPTRVMVAAARAVPSAASPVGLGVALADEPDEAWLGLYRYRGQTLPPVARTLLLSAPQQVFASLVDAGRTVAVGRLAVSRAWGGVTAMQVADSHRRRGLGRVVLAALARESLRRGAPSLYLQVAEDNAPARGLYASTGFEDHHRYSYWSPGGDR